MEIIIESANIPMNVCVQPSDDNVSMCYPSARRECVKALLKKYPTMPEDWNRLVYIQFAVYKREAGSKELLHIISLDLASIKSVYHDFQFDDARTLVSELVDHYSFCPMDSLGSREKRIVDILVKNGFLKIVEETVEKA